MIGVRFGVVLASALTLSACSSGSGGDGRIAAIQALLDAPDNRPAVIVASGHECYRLGGFDSLPRDIHVYDKIKEVHYHASSPAGCFDVQWDPSADVQPMDRVTLFGTMHTNGAPVGRYVVDKVGDEQDGPLGQKVTPFKAHFEKNPPLADELLAAGLWDGKTSDLNDGQAVLHKDADGKWIAKTL